MCISSAPESLAQFVQTNYGRPHARVLLLSVVRTYCSLTKIAVKNIISSFALSFCHIIRHMREVGKGCAANSRTASKALPVFIYTLVYISSQISSLISAGFSICNPDISLA